MLWLKPDTLGVGLGRCLEVLITGANSVNVSVLKPWDPSSPNSRLYCHDLFDLSFHSFHVVDFTLCAFHQ